MALSPRTKEAGKIHWGPVSSFSCWVVSDSFQLHGLQHSRLPCPSLYWVCSNSHPLGLVMPSNNVIFCYPLLLPSVFPSIMVFSIESVLCIRWPRYWSFSFSLSPSNEYSMISFSIDWFDLFAVQVISDRHYRKKLQCVLVKVTSLSCVRLSATCGL